MYATNYFENAMINLARGLSITAPSNVYIGLFINNPTDTGGGTEISYNGYVRQPIIFSAPTASGDGLMIQNNASITFAESPTAAGNAAYVGIMDGLSGGNMWLYGQLETSLTIAAGVSPVIRAESVRWIWSGNFGPYYRTAIMNVMRGSNAAGFSPHIGLFNGDPLGSGSEFSGNNYARIPFTLTAPVQQSNGTAQSENSAEVISGVASGNWGAMTHVAIFDALSNGAIFAAASLGSSYSMTSGNTAGFHAGDLKFNVN